VAVRWWCRGSTLVDIADDALPYEPDARLAATMPRVRGARRKTPNFVAERRARVHQDEMATVNTSLLMEVRFMAEFTIPF
jgi:hypothetical protein